MEPSELSHGDLVRVVKRDRWVKEQQTARIAGLLQENVELLGLFNEVREDLAVAQQEIESLKALVTVASNGEVSTPEVPSGVTS